MYYHEENMQHERLVLPSGVVVRGSAGERYVIEGLPGRGEMGAVYLVRDRHMKGMLFALKCVSTTYQLQHLLLTLGQMSIDLAG